MSNMRSDFQTIVHRLSWRGLKKLGTLSLLTHLLAMATYVYASDFHSPRTAALGGAGHASPLLNDAILLNPSFAAFLNDRVSAGFSYQNFEAPSVDSSTQPEGEFSGRSYQVSLQDGRSPLFEAGVAYTRNPVGSSVHIGAARTFVQQFGFGVGAKLLFNEERTVMDPNYSLSITGSLFQEIQFSITADNLINNLGRRSRGLLEEYTLGTKINIMDLLLFYIDPHYFPDPQVEQSDWGLEAGVEIVLMNDLFLRFGRYTNSQIPWILNSGLSANPYGKGYGMGLGWLGPKISFDFSFARTSLPFSSSSYNMSATLYL